MKRYVLSFLAAAAIVLSADAQQAAVTPPPANPRYFPPGQAPQPKQEGPRFDLDFKGGVPQQLLQQIEGQLGDTRPNVVIHPECKDARLPAVQLRGVTAAQVFNTFNTLAEPEYKQGYWRRVMQDDGEVWTFVKMERAQPYADPGMGFGMTPPKPRTAKVFNLTGVLDEYKIDDVTTAVQAAWDLLAVSPQPSLKFHTDTRLLIVVGEAEHLNIVSDVIRELQNNVISKNPLQTNSSTNKPAAKPVTPPQAKQL